MWMTSKSCAVSAAITLTAQETGTRWFEVVKAGIIANDGHSLNWDNKWCVIVHHHEWQQQHDYYLAFNDDGTWEDIPNITRE